MRKAVKYSLSVLLLLALGYNAVYFKKLDEVKASAAAKSFNASAFAQKFWVEKLVPNLTKAVEITSLAQMLGSDPQKAFDAHSHALGIGNLRYFLVQGKGTVAAVNEDDVTLLVKADSAQQAVTVATEFIFGNAVRDATGFINVNEFKNTMDFNNVSAALNKTIRDSVLPPFKASVKKGDPVQFTGALELNKEHVDTKQWEIIPVQLKILN